jgi:hypothetical protein
MSADTEDDVPGIRSDTTPGIRQGKVGDRLALLCLDDLDRRRGAFKKTVSTIKAIETDLGGSSRLSTQERTIVQRAAVLAAIAEHIETQWLGGRAISPIMLCTVDNSLKRLLEAVGLKRQSRPVNELDQHLLAALQQEYGDGS